MNFLYFISDILFPVLDVSRLAVRNEDICMYLLEEGFLETIMIYLSSTPPNQLMSVRCIANMVRHSFAQKHIKSKLESIIASLINIQQGSVNLQIALATLYLNLTITQTVLANADECRIITEGITNFLKWCTDLEAFYRCIQGLGNLLCTPYGGTTSAQIISAESVLDKIREYSNTQQAIGFEKITECAKELLAAF